MQRAWAGQGDAYSYSCLLTSSYPHASWLRSPSSKEAEAAAAHQQDKALPTLQGHPGSCISASAALNVQTAQEMSPACPAARQVCS